MESPLWIDRHAPSLGELPQAEVRNRLEEAVDKPITLILQGPGGAGKTAAVRAMAAIAHSDPENDLIEINVADFFDMTKTELRNDPRFEQFLTGRSDLSKGQMINHVVKESAAHSPVTSGYKTILLDNAEAIREDFQQALRRVMERHHGTTQFVITTRQPSKLLPAIRSRGVTVPVRSPTEVEIAGVLDSILTAEDVEQTEAGRTFLANHAAGDLRRAILSAQTVAEAEGRVDRETAYDVLREIGPDDRIAELISQARTGEFSDARSQLDDLLIKDGYGGDEILRAIIRVARTRGLIDDVWLTRLAGRIDYELAEGTNDRLHLANLLAELGRI